MKPIVFISHSSRDAEFVTKLQQLLLERTSYTIQFFVSSDRESIPVGKMWVQQILDAVGTSSFTIALLSPNSMQSQWIPFEVALCYARGIPIVLVGIRGVDATALSPPLGLVQGGFNLDSQVGLDRLVSDLNTAFGHRHPVGFTADEYASLWDAPVLPLPDGDYEFRVFTTGKDGEKPHERLKVRVHGSTMIAQSSRAEQWESVGMFERNRYFGRFKFLRGSATEDLGIHDFNWNGREFVGSAKLDSGRWAIDNLIWRPTSPIDNET